MGLEWQLSTLFDSLSRRFPTASHRNQMTSSNSLAGESAFNDSLLVPKRQNVLKAVHAAQSAKGKD
jgi:hypothetical protein